MARAPAASYFDPNGRTSACCPTNWKTPTKPGLDGTADANASATIMKAASTIRASDRKARSDLATSDWTNRMIISGIGIVTTGTVAIAKIDLLRVHAAELYVAPAIGEFFDCKCWRHQAESFFFGQWADVEHAHAMLATVRCAMEQEFADFFETGTGADNPRALAASFSKGMGQRISQRLRRLKAGRPATVLASGKDLAAAIAKLLPGASLTRAKPSIGTLAYAAGVEAGDRVELVAHGSSRGNGR